MKNSIFLALIIFLFTPFYQTNAQTPFDAELLWRLSRVSAPALSPDGKTIAYGVKRYNIQENKGYNFIYTIPAEGGDPVLVADSTEKAHSPSWRPDGKKIMYLSSKEYATQIWQMNPDGTEKQIVSTMDKGVSNFAFSNDGTMIWFTSEVKVTESPRDFHSDLSKSTGRVYDDLMYRHWDQWADDDYSHVFYTKYDEQIAKFTGEIVDIMKNEPFDSPLMPFGGSEHISWSPDGKKIAYTCKKLNGVEYAMSTNSEIYLYDLETKQTTNITNGMKGYDTQPAFSPDGKKLTWLSMETPMYEADRNRLFELDFETGTKTELTEGFDYTIDSYQWSSDGKTIYFKSGINGVDQLWTMKLSAKNKPELQQLTKAYADINSFVEGKAGKKSVLIASSMSISKPTEIYNIDIKTGEATELTFTNREMLADVKMGRVEKRMIEATDGEQILTWVIYPPDFDPSKKYPTLLYCQGGPQGTVSQFFSYRWNFQIMAAQGYIVVAPNRRGLPSFGTKWNRDISGDWGGQAMKDLLSAIDEVGKESFVDNDRLGAVGASFGGYTVFWLAGNHNKRFKAFISHCGVFNLESMYGTTEELFFADFEMEGSYFKKPQPKSYTEFNPIKYVDKWDTPIMIIHNDLDYRVPISQGMEAFTAARLNGVPARFLSFPDENHWVLKPQNGVLWQRMFFEWLGMHLR